MEGELESQIECTVLEDNRRVDCVVHAYRLKTEKTTE